MLLGSALHQAVYLTATRRVSRKEAPTPQNRIGEGLESRRLARNVQKHPRRTYCQNAQTPLKVSQTHLEVEKSISWTSGLPCTRVQTAREHHSSTRPCDRHQVASLTSPTSPTLPGGQRWRHLCFVPASLRARRRHPGRRGSERGSTCVGSPSAFWERVRSLPNVFRVFLERFSRGHWALQ